MDRETDCANFCGFRENIPKLLQELAFGRARKLSQFDDRKSPNINNMGQLTIAKFRCLGAAEMPTLEVVWV